MAIGAAMSERRVMLRGVQYTGRVDLDGLRPAFVLLDKWLARDNSPVLTAVQPGSRTASDDAACDPHHLSHGVLSALAHGIDHLHALRSLVVKAEDLHIYAPWALLRGTLENACVALWLLEPEDDQERIRRRLVLAVADMRNGDQARRLALDPGENVDEAAEAARSQRRLQQVAERAEAAGLRRDDVLGKAPGFARIVREAASGTTFDGSTLELVWRTCSGLTHGQQWATLGMLQREQIVDDEGDPDVVRLQLTTPTDSVVLATRTVTLLLDRGWRLFDRHRLAWKTHRRPESRPAR